LCRLGDYFLCVPEDSCSKTCPLHERFKRDASNCSSLSSSLNLVSSSIRTTCRWEVSTTGLRHFCDKHSVLLFAFLLTTPICYEIKVKWKCMPVIRSLIIIRWLKIISQHYRLWHENNIGCPRLTLPRNSLILFNVDKFWWSKIRRMLPGLGLTLPYRVV
jgi:hypothetical protein